MGVFKKIRVIANNPPEKHKEYACDISEIVGKVFMAEIKEDGRCAIREGAGIFNNMTIFPDEFEVIEEKQDDDYVYEDNNDSSDEYEEV